MAYSYKIVLIDEQKGTYPYMDLIAHSTMGVVSKARSEQGNYVPPILPERYNAFLFIDQPRALAPLSGMPGGRKILLRDSDNKSKAGIYSYL